MTLLLKVLTAGLMGVAVFMGIKQGWAMLTGQPAMEEMLTRLGLEGRGIHLLGWLTVMGSVLVLLPQTFVWGNVMMAAGILLILALQVHQHNLRGAAIEVPFLLLSLLILYLQHPLARR